MLGQRRVEKSVPSTANMKESGIRGTTRSGREGTLLFFSALSRQHYGVNRTKQRAGERSFEESDEHGNECFSAAHACELFTIR